MPALTPYEGGDLEAARGLKAPDAPASRWQQAARVAGALGRETAQQTKEGFKAAAQGLEEAGAKLQQHAEYVERNQLNTKLDQIETDFYKGLDEAGSLPSDQIPAALAALRAGSIERMNDWAASATTDRNREWATTQQREVHMRWLREETVMGAQAQSAFAADQANSTMSTINQTIATRPDEAGIRAGLAQFDRRIDSLLTAGHWTPETRERFLSHAREMREQIVAGGLHQAIIANPDYGQTLINKFAGDVKNPAITATLDQAVESRKDRALSEETRKFYLDRAKEEETSQKAAADIYASATLDANGVRHFPANTDRQVALLEQRGVLREAQIRQLQSDLDRSALGIREESRVGVASDLYRRALQGDPTVAGDIVAGLAQHTLTGAEATELRSVAADKFAQSDFNSAETAINAVFEATGDSSGPLAALAAKRDLSDQLRAGRALGTPSGEIIDRFTKALAAPEKQQQYLAIGRGEASPISAQVSEAQQARSTGVKIAQVAAGMANMLSQSGSPRQIALTVKNATGYEIPEAHIADGRWCADLVNAVLHGAGFSGTDSSLAVSFVQRSPAFTTVTTPAPGDVFYAEPTVTGTTGHVGIVVGSPDADGRVPVISSHTQGPASNPPGLEHRKMAGLVFRRVNTEVPRPAATVTGPPARSLSHIFSAAKEELSKWMMSPSQ